MKTYGIYTCQDKMPELVKQGFSWPAFFFSWVWALFNGLFLHAFLMLVALNVITNLSGVIVGGNTGNEIFGKTVRLLVAIGVLAVIGAYANHWKVKKLIKKGYAQFGTVDAPNFSTAIHKLEPTIPASDGEKGLAKCAPIESLEPWQCAVCAEQIEAQFSSCWKCGTDRAERS